MLGPAFRLLKGTRSNYAELEYNFKECYKALSEKLDMENPEGDDYPFDLSKPLPLIKRGKHQRVPFEFFINNDLKYLQGGILTMTYPTSTTKTKAANYDLPGIEDMVPNIWSPIKISSSSNVNSKVHTCSTECEQSYEQLKKLYDTQREQLGDASIEIQAYTQALKKVEAQLVTHQKNQLWYEEKIRFMKIDLDDKTDVLTYHKKLLAEAVKEKEELKTKLENFQSSSKGLSKLLNSQMSKRDKSGLGFSHLIKDCDFHEKRIAKQVELNKKKRKGTVQGENRPVWNNVQRLNHQNKFVPTAPVRSENQANKTAGPKEANHSACTQDNIDAGNSKMEAKLLKTTLYCQYGLLILQQSKAQKKYCCTAKRQEKEANDAVEALRKEFAQEAEDLLLQAGATRATSTNTVNTASTLDSNDESSQCF
ncbi:hypothetical protein Tco_0237707 [Tanacetum coccineum]